VATPLVRILFLKPIRWNKISSYTQTNKYPLYVRDVPQGNPWRLHGYTWKGVPSYSTVKQEPVEPGDALRLGFEPESYIYLVSELYPRQSSKCDNSKLKQGRVTVFCTALLLNQIYLPTCARHVVSIWWSFMWNICKIRLQITKLWARYDFAARSCCDLDFQDTYLNVARDTSSQYGYHFCEIDVKSDFK
jgi:hypothetical protein